MSEFKELVKSFSKSREYVRDFFVYGFKTRGEFGGYSGRTYDNERRRIESWLSDCVRQEYGKEGKHLYLSVDSSLADTNPLYQVFKTKSFTDNDMMLHFYILDYLAVHGAQTAERLADGILSEYGFLFDTQLIRRKCNRYAKEGMLKKEKRGRELFYKPGLSARRLLSSYPAFGKAVLFYQLISPLGILGNTVMEQASLVNDLFWGKHNFFVHTLEDEILLVLLCAIHQERAVALVVKSTRSDRIIHEEGVPLQIFVSVRTGRRYVVLYLPGQKHWISTRLDAIKKAEQADVYPDYGALRKMLEQNKRYAWGVSFQNESRTRRERVKLTLRIDEETESFVVSRLKREGKGGEIRRIAPDTFTYETEVFDANEMLPWIRTFLGRILAAESDSERLTALLRRDFAAMYRMYFKE